VAVGAGRRGPEDWEVFRRQHPDMTQRIIVADANFDSKSLSGFDLSRCYFTRVSFVDANLSNTDFRQSIFRNCDARGSNIEGALFQRADLFGDGLRLTSVRVSKDTDFEVDIDKLPDDLDPRLRAAAIRARNDRRWRNRKSRSIVVRSILWLTRYGYSAWRLSLLGVIVLVTFATLFFLLGQPIEAAALASGGYFLGVSSSFKGGILLALGLLEKLIGLIFFAILTAVLFSLFFEKN
jgi:hypothetical protein